MKIFLYEFVTGGGWYSVGHQWPPPMSLVAEGLAMLAALATDFTRLPNVEVVTLRDSRLPPYEMADVETIVVDSAMTEQAAFETACRAANWTIVIAPEIGGALVDRCAKVAEAGGRLLGPSQAALAIAGDKHRTCEHLLSRGVPTPRGVLLGAQEPLPCNFKYPAVLKPCDGAGSLGIFLVNQVAAQTWRTGQGVWRLEEFCAGQPASVAVLCGPSQLAPLEPCAQYLSVDGSFTYLGGSLPLQAPQAARAVALALRSVSTLAPGLGYLGVDLILGEPADGSGDRVIEINPRLTTSYVGLRAASQVNLAGAMLTIADDGDAAVCFGRQRVEFDASGNVSQQSLAANE